jgi:hypothetical protein
MRSALFSARAAVLWCAAILGSLLLTSAVSAEEFEIRQVAEKQISQLPSEPLFWRIDNFPTLAQAQAAAGPTALAAEMAGKVWLFTLGPAGGSSPGGNKVAEVGPVPSPGARSEYTLRINEAGGQAGAKTPVHTHPGSETFYVLRGQLSQKTPSGVTHVDAGQGMPGRTPGMAMEVSSTGSEPLDALVMFVVDAKKPFSSPATFE